MAFEQEIDGAEWPAFLQELTFGGHFNRAWRAREVAEHSENWVIVSDDLEHSTVGIIFFFFFRVSNRGVNALCVLSNFDLLAAAFQGGGGVTILYQVIATMHTLNIYFWAEMSCGLQVVRRHLRRFSFPPHDHVFSGRRVVWIMEYGRRPW